MASYETNMTENMQEWPYPVNYGRENEVSADVLIIGGGLAGCHAAISAARKGVKVVVVDKAAVIRSGSGGAGIDHWHDAFTNPCSVITPEEAMEMGADHSSGRSGSYALGHAGYIGCKESYDALLDIESAGVKIRDEENEFEGAEFRDDETRLMFAYDYKGRHTIRLRAGAVMKPALYKELKRLKVEIIDRVMVTSLLTEDCLQGSRVIGATGVNVRTGEFYIFKAKATVLASSGATRLWVFSTELRGFASEHADPNNAGDGHAMAWDAGAEFTLMERSGRSSGGFGYPAYGLGGPYDTWYACSIVDSNGKEVPWIDRDGNIIDNVEYRYRPAPGQKLFVGSFGPTPYEIHGPRLLPDLAERIRKGEYVLPLYADLPGMSEHERRAIFGLMIGNEGKTRIPIYEYYTQAGFDPDKDMLLATVMPPEMLGARGPWWGGVGPAQWRTAMGGGLVFDWELKTSLEGLYGGGSSLAGVGGAAGSCTSGRYAGRNAASYAGNAHEPRIERSQVDKEKARVYAPVNRTGAVGWKELHAGICRIMQDYCGEYKSEETLKTGLIWLSSIRESEASQTGARNPHELMRTLECMSRISVGEMILNACLARRASSRALGFNRLDHPETDPPEWQKFVTVKMVNGKIKEGALPLNYWLLPPYAPTYKENYDKYCGL